MSTQMHVLTRKTMKMHLYVCGC